MSEHHFVPNDVARQLAGQRRNALGVIVRNISDPFWPEVVRGIENICEQHRYSLLFLDSFGDAEREARALSTCRSNKVAAIILGPVFSNANYRHFDLLKKENVPLIVLDELPDYKVHLVAGCNDEAVGWEVTGHLAKLGYKGIGFLGSSFRFAAPDRRMKGYRKALEHYRLPLREEWLAEVDEQSISAGYQAAKRLLSCKKPPRALFVYCDILAIGCLQAAAELKLRVPQDVALASVDDIAFAAHARVPLTTFALNQFGLGRKAAEQAVKLADKPEERRYSRILHEVLAGQLIVRQSCGAR
jgi:LacI family transcriptional regulator